MDLLFDIDRVSVWDDKNLNMDTGDADKTMWIYLITLNCSLKIIKMVNYVLYIIRFLKKWRFQILNIVENIG